MRTRVRAAWAIAALVSTMAGRAYADDVADEADLHFQLGADKYRQGDYLGALEQFMTSNRLVGNRNVSFNIARCYEQLGKYPEAYRYYAQSLEGETQATARTRIVIALDRIKPHVALLHIATDPPGATLYMDRRDLGSRGTSPRSLGLAPGRYRVIAEKPGYEPAESAEIDAEAAGELHVELKLARKAENQRASLVIDSDEPGALIEVDGKPSAFTPAILTVAAGAHQVRVSRKGFRSVVESVVVAADTERHIDIALVPSQEVTAASRGSETLDQAPGSVTIIGSDELRSMAYPTIAEALRGVRGVYVWDDRSYTSVGFRGLGRPGSYSNRALVLLDGQPLNDDWIGSSYTGYDGRTDLEDIDRIEVIRGPGSVLYGTNAFSGVINLVTRDAGAATSREVGISTNEYGVARARGRYAARFSDRASAWMSVAAAHGSGRDYYFPELAASNGAPGDGAARGVDGFQSGTLSGRFTWGSFTTQWLLHSRDKHSPTGVYNTILGDSRLHQVDTRAMVEARFEPVIGKAVQLMSRAHGNLYSFRGSYPRTPDQYGLERDGYDGNWFGLEQRVVLALAPAVRLTAGGEAQFHLGVHQTAENDRGIFLDDRRPYQVQAGYLLADLGLTQNVRLSGGLRLDHYSTFGSSLNPRLALITEPYDGGNLKIMVGKAFRAPSIYELYYSDGGFTQIPNPTLSPESIASSEVEYSHRFSPAVVATASTFANLVTDLIVLRGEEQVQYQNLKSPVFIMGGELELRREWRKGWSFAASYSYQHSRFLPDHAAVSDVLQGNTNPNLRHVGNSPAHLGAIKAAVPLMSRALLASTRVAFEGPRWDRHERTTDPIQSRTDPSVVWDIVLSGDEPRWGLRYAVGVYNAFDWRYSAPLSAEFRQTTIVQNGRTFLASMSLAF